MTERNNDNPRGDNRTMVENRAAEPVPPPGQAPANEQRPRGAPNQGSAPNEGYAPPNQGYGPNPGYAPNYGYGPNRGYAPGYGYGPGHGAGYAYAPMTANHEQITLASGANLILGLWLIAAPFVLNYAPSVARGNDVVMGIIIATLAAVRVFGAYRAAWVSWLNVLAGIWMIIAPFALGYSGFAHPTWNDIIVGALVVAFGAWSALATHGSFYRGYGRNTYEG